MTIYATGNPVGSTSPKDLIDNSQNFDYLILGPLLSYPDRRGVNRLSWAGIEASFAAAQAQRTADFNAAQVARQSQFDAYLAATGFEYPPLPFFEGTPLTVYRSTQLVQYGDNVFSVRMPASFPYSLTGVWAVDQTHLVLRNDQAIRQDLAESTGATMIGLKASSSPDAVWENVATWISRQMVDLETFGGSNDYLIDNQVALAKLVANGHKGMRLNLGIYRFGDTANFKTGFTIIGQGLPRLGHGTFDDKQFLRTGYKHLMRGSSMIFSGSASASYPCPQRIGEFATLRPCVRISQAGAGAIATNWSNFAIIQDMECVVPDGSRMTKPWEDNRSDYDTGLMIDDVSSFHRWNVGIFGYFSKIGTVISSVMGNDDPDYNTAWGGYTMGKYGFALLGSNNGPTTAGLSGTRCYGHDLYTLDHHSRGEMTLAELTAYYSTADTWSLLYVDGDLDASSAEINGHEFHGCNLRGNSNHAIRIDHCSNLKFFGGVYEFRPYNVPNSDVPTFLATANVKRGVAFYDMRNNYLSTILNPNFIGVIPVKVIVTGDPLNGRLGVFGRDPDGVYSGVILGSDGNIGDAAIQLTRDASNGSSGWRGSMDVSSGDTLNWSYDGVNLSSMTTDGIRVHTGGERRHLSEVGPALTIASDTITVTRSVHAVAPESGTTDNISTINGGVAGMTLTLRPVSSSHVITIVRTGGNIRLDASTNKVLNGSLSSIRLYYNGSFWIQDGAIMTNG